MTKGCAPDSVAGPVLGIRRRVRSCLVRELGIGRRQAGAAGDTGWSWPVWVALGVAFAAGVGLRWYLLTTDLAYVDVDEATIGLQARDFLTSPDVFFPAQPYGGSLEVPFVAVLSELGARGPLWLKLVPMAFHLATCVVAWRVATRFVPSRLGQLAVPVVLWCGPAYGIWESTKERGFYGAALLVAATVLLLGLRVLEQPGRASCRRLRRRARRRGVDDAAARRGDRACRRLARGPPARPVAPDPVDPARRPRRWLPLAGVEPPPRLGLARPAGLVRLDGRQPLP